MPLAEIVRLFDLPQVLRHNARFDPDKLLWLEGEYMKELTDEAFRQLGTQALARAGYQVQAYSPQYVQAALETCKGKIKRFADLGPYAGFYFSGPPTLEAATAQNELTPEAIGRLGKLRQALEGLEDFSAASIEKTLKRVAADLSIKPALLVHPARLACTGSAAGPSLYHLMEILGKRAVLERLERLISSR
jgi:glutamyl-tRNA synthetase